MRAILELHSPVGEPTRRQAGVICELLRLDNMLWIAGRLNTNERRQGRGQPQLEIPRCARAGGVRYVPPQGAEKLTGEQRFLSAPWMFYEGKGSCCDIGPYDAAALCVLYEIPSRTLSPAQGATSYHCNVLTPWGAYDPTIRWNDDKYLLPPLEWGKARCREYVQKMVTGRL